MIVRCNHCNQPIYLTCLQPEEYGRARESFLKETGQPKKTSGFWSKLKKWASDKRNDEFSETFYDGKGELVCTNCHKETRIRIDNVVSFQQGDTNKLGITWRYFCTQCNQIVESLPLKVGQKNNYELNTCPLCRNTDLKGEHIPGYQGGSGDFGLSDSQALAKKYFYVVKSLLEVCCMSKDRFEEDDFLLFDDLGNTLINKSLSSGELDFSKVTANWQSIAASFEKLRERFEQLNIVSAEQINRKRQEWDDLKERMGTGQHIPAGNVGNDFIEKMKKHPEIVGFVEEGLRKFGDNPVPKIIQQLVTDGLGADAQVMANIWLSYIGEPAIPHLIKLLGHDNYQLAMFAAKTLADIEGSMAHIKRSLMSEDPNTRLHAAGSLQYFGSKGKELIPDLCDLIEREIIDQGAIEAGKISEPADVAAGALGKMGDSALPMVGELLNSDNVNIRLAAVSALLRIGESALPILIEARSKEMNQFVLTALQDTIRRIEETA